MDLVDTVRTQAEKPTSDSQLLKVVLGRSPARPASAADGCQEDATDDVSWQIGEMRPRGYSAPASKQLGRSSNGCQQLRVPEEPRSSRTFPVIHALRKVTRSSRTFPVIHALRKVY